MTFSRCRPALLACAPFMVAAIASADPVDYARDVKPVLKARCYACHGGLKQASGLRLDTGELIRRGGDGGEVITPGQPDDSPLIERVSAAEITRRMPPEGEPLTSEQIASLRNWILQGAAAPPDETPEPDPRKHWAFIPPVRPVVPTTLAADAQGVVGHPIDAFLNATLARHSLDPLPPASRSLQLRRITLDLTGLPPTADELQAFLADESPEAYDRLVERLLNSPRYGERWGRHWMDVWRYSDWYGRRDANDVRNSFPTIWRWRDWIVRSLNKDQGYDQMVRGMLAADEIAPDDVSAHAATGFIVRNWYSLNYHEWMRDLVEHTGKAFLGLTMNCAHGHDHKYDPISHEDYFRMRAFFEPLELRRDPLPEEPDPGPFKSYIYGGSTTPVPHGLVRIFDHKPDAETFMYTQGDFRNRIAGRPPVMPGVPEFLAASWQPVETLKLPPRAWYPGLRPGIQETRRNERRAALARSQEELAMVRASTDSALVQRRAATSQAEARYALAAREAKAAGQPGPLAGEQSLLLDATLGRCIVQHSLAQAKPLESGARLSFLLHIVKDAHANFQLVKDHVKGLTASFVAFEQGRILAYQPGSVMEFVAGRYDLAADERQFALELLLEPIADRCLLTVRSGEKLLVDHTPVALNGWNPVGDTVQAISFDVRTGAVVAIDDLGLTVPLLETPDKGEQTTRRLAWFDFEPPQYLPGQDIAGMDGWRSSPFGQLPATSLVVTSLGDDALRLAVKELAVCRRAVRLEELKLNSAQERVNAESAELAALEARIAADQAKYGESSAANVTALIRAASRAEREAAVATSHANVLTKELALASADLLDPAQSQRAAEIEAAQKQVAEARAAVERAKGALSASDQENTYSPLTPMYPETSTGRRTALAGWIASRENPLTARVAVNHIWMRHFGRPLVATVADFGRNGQLPTHPELLDWLAVEFMESGWNMKHLHRLMVTSSAYRRASLADPRHPGRAVDPENRWLWHFPSRRLEGEAIRDGVLHLAGGLDPQMGGPELDLKTQSETPRRSLYFTVHAEGGGRLPWLDLFDPPDPCDCYRRTTSIVPQQALALTNSPLLLDHSRRLARTLWSQVLSSAPQADHPREFVDRAFQQILTRRPSSEESAACLEFLATQQQLFEAADPQHLAAQADGQTPPSVDPGQRARESLIRSLFNHNDFVTLR
ncbi:MAG: PSD1 and planctomycete cytochrome C domain-containing protein [Planctomycetales bacterium]